jgi:sugar phosphate isomerase/epimerase
VRDQRRTVLLARDLATDVVILNAASAVPGQEQAQWERLRRALDALLPLAQAEGVRVCLEPEPGHFLQSSADMRRLLDEMAHPSLGVNLDVGHAFLTDEDVSATIADLGPAIAHTHIEGMAAGVHAHLIPGEGDLDLRAAHRALIGVGYDGYYTVDLFNIADDPEAYARRSIEALRAMLGA